MSIPLPVPPIEANVSAPVSDSCNCCDKSTFNFFCCMKKNRTPKHECDDKKTQEVSKDIKPKDETK